MILVYSDEEFVNNAAMTSEQPKPTVAELEILQVLWDGDPRSVREIQRVMNDVKPTGYTTVVKLL